SGERSQRGSQTPATGGGRRGEGSAGWLRVIVRSWRRTRRGGGPAHPRGESRGPPPRRCWQLFCVRERGGAGGHGWRGSAFDRAADAVAPFGPASVVVADLVV